MGRIRAAILASAGLVGALAATSASRARPPSRTPPSTAGDYTLGSFHDAAVTVNSYGQSATGGNPARPSKG